MHCCIPTPSTDSNTITGMIWVTLNMASAAEECREPSGHFTLSGERSPWFLLHLLHGGRCNCLQHVILEVWRVLCVFVPHSWIYRWRMRRREVSWQRNRSAGINEFLASFCECLRRRRATRCRVLCRPRVTLLLMQCVRWLVVSVMISFLY